MSDVIDIIHRLSYEVNDADLLKATAAVSRQIQEVERLEKEVKALAKEFSKTAETDIAKREELIRKITANRNAVKQLNDELEENILHNKDLQAVLQREQGIIGNLNTQLDLLKKKRDAATDPKAIQDYNRQIAAINQRLTSSNTLQGPQGGNTLGASVALSNIVRDAPFGVIGVTNNITQLTDSLAILRQQTGSTGAALRAMFASLAGPAGVALGISIVTSLLTVLVQKYGSLSNAIDHLFGTLSAAEKAQKALTSSFEGANKEYEKAVANVNQLRNNIQLAKDGFLDKDKVVKEYNQTIGKTTGAVKSLDEAEQQLAKNADAYIRFTLLKAAANVALEEAAKKAFETELTRQKKLTDFSGLPGLNQKGLLSVLTTDIDDVNKLKKESEASRKERKNAAIKTTEDEKKTFEGIARDLNKQAAELAKKYGFDFFADILKPEKAVPENVYQQKLQELKARLAAITASVFQSDDTIRKKVAEEVKKGQEEMDRLFKDKKLTAGQRDTLKALVGTIGDAELQKELDEFNKKRLAAQRKIDAELNSLLLEEAEQRTQLIRDDFERQSQLIDTEFQKQADSLKKAKEDLLRENQEGLKTGLISGETARANADEIERIYAELLDNLVLLTNKKRGDLALSLFDDALKFDKTFFATGAADEAERVAADVRKLVDTYLKGKITFDRYQKELTKILNTESNRRRELNIRELQDELDIQQRKLQAAQGISSEKELNDIEKRIADLRAQIAQLKQEGAQSGVTQQKQQKDQLAEAIKNRIKLFQDLANAAVQAYSTIVQAQEQQAQRDIDIQQNRVERARAIADRGNAKALQAEEERLNKLQKQREKYAQQQLAINAIQTLSSSILAIATAAGESGAGAIVIVPAVIAALAAGFAAVKAMASDTQGFFQGVVGLEGTGTATSDSIPAKLSKGESVVTAKGTMGHQDILEGMNAGKRYRLIDHNKITEMAPGSGLPILQSIPVQGIVVMNAGSNNQDYKLLLREVKDLKETIASKPTSSWHLDRRGFVAMYQDEINFQGKMKNL